MFMIVGTVVLARTWVRWNLSEFCAYFDRSKPSTESLSSRWVDIWVWWHC